MKYPSWRYHARLPAVIVRSPEEDAALGDGWADTPAAFAGRQEPEEQADALRAAAERRRRGKK